MGNIYLPKLVSQKYDEAMDYHITMYDNLPYRRDSDFCGIQQVSLYSGHIIKYYLCLNHEDAYEVGNHDDEIEEILAVAQKNEAKRMAMPEKKQTGKSKREEQGITQEQIKTLLKDNSAPPASDDNLAPANAVNAFEGVEDW